MDHLAVKDRERRERGPYRASGTTAQRAYPTTSALVRYQDEDDYSYTGPREQFDRDYPAQPRPARRDSNTRRERPMSVIDYADSKTLPPAKREPGPPPSATRQLERIGNASGRNSNGRTATGGETERDLDVPRRTHSTRAPVSLHQEREDGYSSQRDDFGDREKHRHHREKSGHDSAYFSDRDRTHHRRHDDRHARPRDASPDPSGAGKGLAVAGLGGIAAAGLAKILPKTTKDPDPDNSDDERKERRTRKRREQDPNDNVFTEDSKARSDRPRDRPQDSRQPRESRRENADRDRVDSDSLEDQPSQRHRRRKHRSKGNNGREEGSGSDLEERPPADHSREDVRWDERFAERVNDDASFGKTEAPVRNPSFAEGFSGPPGDSDDDRPRRVQLVEPLKENQQDQRPKGILKPARQVPFPEDPNPTREGVAPLKEAGKKGVPPGARWTKINRMLVNPAALDAAHERYEEREEYVIVLRVLSREEIEKFAIKTREIRETRDKEWEEEQRQRAGRPRDEVDDGSSDDEHRTPLALGAPTSSPTSIPNKRPTVLPGAGYRHQQDS